MVAGLHIPVIAGVFVETTGKTGAGLCRQSGPICEKVGVMLGLTVTDKVVVVAHCPEEAMKV